MIFIYIDLLKIEYFRMSDELDEFTAQLNSGDG
jgi:hypothetical protein